jgi:hypothetical protein
MSEPATVTVKRGSLYLARDVYDRYFAGLEAVVLLRRDDDLLILPVRHAASGGYLLKLRNGAGDRVVSAPDFFREQGLAEDAELRLSVAWNADKAALCSAKAFEL